MQKWVWKPIFIVLAIFAFVVLLINLDTMSFMNVSWDEINPVVIEISPWLVALGLGIFILIYVTGRK